VTSDFLKRQHEEQRLKHAIDYVHDATRGSKHLTTSELARLNQIVIAANEPKWRTENVSIQIPTGRIKAFSVISNPISDARRILGDALDIANNDDARKAAVFLYLQLVDEHLFQEANRRTAALAAQWILNDKDIEIDTLKLLENPLGDVTDPKVRSAAAQLIMDLSK